MKNEDAIVTILTDVTNEQGIEATWLSAHDAGLLRRHATACFGDGTTNALSTETLSSPARLNEEDSWEKLGSFEWTGPVIMFMNPRDSMRMLHVPSMQDAIQLLAEAPPFDFLLMDPQCAFLFAHDQYDNLFGCGLAKEFLERIAR